MPGLGGRPVTAERPQLGPRAVAKEKIQSTNFFFVFSTARAAFLGGVCLCHGTDRGQLRLPRFNGDTEPLGPHVEGGV